MLESHSLTKVEALLLQKLLERDVEITRLYIMPLQKDFDLLFSEIANRLGLSVADQGILYTIDADSMSVQMIEQET